MVYLFHSSFLWRWLVSLVIYAQLVIILWEPAATPVRADHDSLTRSLLWAEAGMAAVLLLDCLLGLYHTGLRGVTWWSGLRWSVVGLVVIDVVGSLGLWGVVRFSRPLRPLLLLVDTSAVKRLVQSVAATVPTMLELGLFAFMVLVVFSASSQVSPARSRTLLPAAPAPHPACRPRPPPTFLRTAPRAPPPRVRHPTNPLCRSRYTHSRPHPSRTLASFSTAALPGHRHPAHPTMQQPTPY
jgi:hypothetical protein